MEQVVARRFREIEGILASVAASQAAAEERANRADARMDRMDARFEKRMRGFEKLAKIGMKEIVELRRQQRETDHKLNALIDSQQRTEATLRALMEGLRRGGNGHNGGRTR
ncbi:MAG: hypothetical protein DMG58_09035 [Acidobacteria bacterium]|nr:MAG: hypothetical protein DMG58_09035 [Acidobacteriota bacterium]